MAKLHHYHDHESDTTRFGSGGVNRLSNIRYESEQEVFDDGAGDQIHYRTMSWQLVSFLMIAEIVSNGTLSLPSSLATVGIVPGVILIVFLGVFATYTSYLLIQFKLRHPEVHTMGDAGYIMFGWIGREIFAAGTVIFAIFGCGSQLLAGQIALGTLSDSKLCLLLYTGIFAIPTFILALPRTFDSLSWLAIPSFFSILVAGIVAMVGAGLNPVEGRVVVIAKSSDFYTAFFSITNPVFAYAGHFMFFVLVSEMRNPREAMKSAYVLQGFATSFYTVFAIVTYYYIGDKVASPSFISLPPVWAKAAFGIAIPNFLLAGSLYTHTAAKLVFVRLFRRGSKKTHIHQHTFLGWATWIALVLLMNGAAFVLAVGVPIFNYLVGIAASLFASWYTYGIAGGFWLYDAWAYRGGLGAWRREWGMASLNWATVVVGAFICVAGLTVTIKGIILAYESGTVPEPFTC